MRARASGSPAATQRSQNPDTMSVSDVPARPAWVSHADNSAKKASFTPRLYSHNAGFWHLASIGGSTAISLAFGAKRTCTSCGCDALGRGRPQRRGTALVAGRSPNEHEESGLVAYDGDVSLAGRGVLQSKHAAGTQSPGLAVGRGDGKGPLQNDAELNCGRRMVEAVFEVLGAPARVKSSEECARGRKIASDVDWRRRRRGRRSDRKAGSR